MTAPRAPLKVPLAMPDLPATLTQPATPKSSRPTGLLQAYVMRDFAATEFDRLSKAEVADPKDRAQRAKALRDLFAVWDGCRIAIRIYKGAGNPKPVTAKNDPSRSRKRAQLNGTPPPPAIVEQAA